MRTLGEFIGMLSPAQKALAALFAAFLAGSAATFIVRDNIGLPARVAAIELVQRDSVLPRLRALEVDANDHHLRLDAQTDLSFRLLAQLDSIARNTCLALAELRSESSLPCNRTIR